MDRALPRRGHTPTAALAGTRPGIAVTRPAGNPGTSIPVSTRTGEGAAPVPEPADSADQRLVPWCHRRHNGDGVPPAGLRSQGPGGISAGSGFDIRQLTDVSECKLQQYLSRNWHYLNCRPLALPGSARPQRPPPARLLHPAR